jgi:hypothetical protein
MKDLSTKMQYDHDILKELIIENDSGINTNGIEILSAWEWNVDFESELYIMVEFLTDDMKDINGPGTNITTVHHIELEKYKQRIAERRNKKLDDLGI